MSLEQLVYSLLETLRFKEILNEHYPGDLAALNQYFNVVPQGEVWEINSIYVMTKADAGCYISCYKEGYKGRLAYSTNATTIPLFWNGSILLSEGWRIVVTSVAGANIFETSYWGIKRYAPKRIPIDLPEPDVQAARVRPDPEM